MLLAVAAAVRVVAMVAVFPGLWFSDSNGYVVTAATGTLNPVRVSGYSLVVAPFWRLGSAAALIGLQHLIGLGLVVALHALLVRRGVPGLAALLAVVPAALDGYLIAVEHAIMSDTVFHAALVGAVVLLLWSDRLSPAAAAGAGVLLGYAGVVRSVGLAFVAVVLAYALARRPGPRALALLVAGWLAVTAGYAAIYDAQHGTFALSEWGGRFLYARVAPLADCARLRPLTAGERALCPDPRRRLTTSQYLWSRSSPIHGLPPGDDRRIRDFALRVIRDDPPAYARVVALDFVHYFEPGHRVGPNDYSPAVWRFPKDPSRPHFPHYRGPIRPHHPHEGTVGPKPVIDALVSRPRTDAAASRFLRGYQGVVYLTGPALALCVLVVLAALWRRRGAARLRLDAAFLAALALAALATAVAVSLFSYRYGLIAVVLLPPAAALAATSLRTSDEVA